MTWQRRLLRRLKPREGWLILVLTWLAVICLPGQAGDVSWLVGMTAGLWLASLALLIAWRLSHTRLHAGLALCLLLPLGILADLIWGVYVLDPWPLLGEAGRQLAWWLAPQNGPAPHWSALPAQWAALLDFGQRLGWWFAGLTGSRGIPDNLIVSALALLLVWGAAAWAGWWIVRRGRPFEALLPTIVLMAAQAYVTTRGVAWLLCVVSLLPLLSALARTRWLADRWEAAGADYSSELHLTAGIVGFAVTLVVMCVMPALPFLTSREAADFFWQRFQKPYRQVEQRLNESFPAAAGARSLVPEGGVSAGGLPRAHLLGGRPQLGKEIALRITVRGVRPGDLLYWRGQTFAVYDGHGWQTGAGQPLLANLAAGQAWSGEALAGRHTLLAFVDVYAAARTILYAAVEPVSADRPYQAVERLPGELVQLQAPGQPDAYTILSAVPDLNPNALRAAGTSYPAEITQAYLQLPANLPGEVAAYAAQVAAGAETPYDAAIAIEKALRQIPYSLDLPAPPPDREMVSWFLFDLKRGYCDYYATAMVVLARARGIPARLAVGYSSGAIEPNTGKYRVTEAQAHTWPELYFPRLGWVPFEPTAAQPEPVRIPGQVPPWLLAGAGPPPIPEADLSEMRARGEVLAAQQAREWRVRWALAVINGLLASWTVWRLLPGSAFRGLHGAELTYARLAGWGARLGRPALPSDTPREYAAALAQAAAQAAGRARYHPAAALQAAETVHDEAARLALELELQAYAGMEAARWAQKRTAPVTSGLQAAPAWGLGDQQHGGAGDRPDRVSVQEPRWTRLWAALRRLSLARRWRI